MDNQVLSKEDNMYHVIYIAIMTVEQTYKCVYGELMEKRKDLDANEEYVQALTKVVLNTRELLSSLRKLIKFC